MADFRPLLFEDRARANYRDEMDCVREIEALLGEKDLEEIEEYREPLSVDVRRELTILLSWGGPSDGYKLYFDKEGDAVEGCYFFAD